MLETYLVQELEENRQRLHLECLRVRHGFIYRGYNRHVTVLQVSMAGDEGAVGTCHGFQLLHYFFDVGPITVVPNESDIPQ